MAAALAHAQRPAADRERDGQRRPGEVLEFCGVEPGMTVADMMAGTGYYTEILARYLGQEGTVYAQNNRYVLERFADEGLSKRLAKPGLERVIRLDTEVDAPELPAGALDAALMFLFYHDTFWMKADRAAMNKAIFDALKPGGVFCVSDHRAAPGAGASGVESIHRIEESIVSREVQAAGFVLEESSALLAHPADDRSGNVFDPEIRGRSDRFLLRFRKPKEAPSS